MTQLLAFYIVLFIALEQRDAEFVGILYTMVTRYAFALVILYVKEESSKSNLRDKNKIKRLLVEQKMMIDNIPDGAMIYNFTKKDNTIVDDKDSEEENKGLELKYTNSSFRKMLGKIMKEQTQNEDLESMSINQEDQMKLQED
jgi:hypothetical protein